MPLRHLHPTGIELVKTVDQLLDLKRADEITSEEVLKESGISKGSLYHHFVDLPDLIETTLIYRYSKWIDLSIQRMSGLLNTAKTPKALKEALFQITFATQKDSLKDMRIERARIFAEAQNNHGYALAKLQRFDEAVAAYDRALALRPEYAEAHSNRGHALADRLLIALIAAMALLAALTGPEGQARFRAAGFAVG